MATVRVINPSAKVILHGCYANRNYGDMILADMMAKYIRTTFEVRTVCPWVHPLEAAHMEAVCGEGLRDCSGAVAAVLGGGGYLESNSPSAARRLARYSDPCKLWHREKIPYVIAGAGVGPELAFGGVRHVESVCSGAKEICVRDEESLETLAKAGIRHPRMHFAADLVLGLKDDDLPSQAIHEAAALLSTHRKNGERLFGVHVPLGRALFPIQRDIIGILHDAFPKHSKTRVVFFEDSPSYSEYHKKLVADLMPWAVAIPNQSRWVTAAMIGQFDAVLTTKLHVAITAWALRVAVCGLSLHPKTERLFRQIARSAYQMNLPEIVPANQRLKRALIRLKLMRQPGLSTACAKNLRDWVRRIDDGDAAFYSDDEAARAELTGRARENFRVVDRLLADAL